MTSETANTPDPSNPTELEARHQEIAAQLDGILVDGERWLVELDRGHVHVTAAEHDTAGRSLLRFTHPDLYGRLLVHEERIRSAGSMFGIPFALLLAFAVIAALDGNWLAGTVPAATLAALTNGWVYVLLIVLASVVMLGLRGLLVRARFRREVEPLLAACRREGFEPAGLVTVLEGDQALDRLTTLLKRQLAKEERGGKHG